MPKLYAFPWSAKLSTLQNISTHFFGSLSHDFLFCWSIHKHRGGGRFKHRDGCPQCSSFALIQTQGSLGFLLALKSLCISPTCSIWVAYAFLSMSISLSLAPSWPDWFLCGLYVLSLCKVWYCERMYLRLRSSVPILMCWCHLRHRSDARVKREEAWRRICLQFRSARVPNWILRHSYLPASPWQYINLRQLTWEKCHEFCTLSSLNVSVNTDSRKTNNERKPKSWNNLYSGRLSFQSDLQRTDITLQDSIYTPLFVIFVFTLHIHVFRCLLPQTRK